MATGTGFTSYSIENDKIFKDALSKAKEVTSDLRIPFTIIARDFYRSQHAIFSLKGPGQYPDLSDKYRERKIKRWGFDYPILKASGKLEAAASIQNGPGNITKIEPLLLQMGVSQEDVPYAIFHQSDKPRKKIPLRKFLFIGPESTFANSDQKGRLERWAGTLKGHIEQVMVKTIPGSTLK